MNAAWRRLTDTRTVRSVVVEFGPPPGARYAALLGRPLTDRDLIERVPALAARDRRTGDAARDRVVVARARAERTQLAGRQQFVHRLAEVAR